MNSLEPVLITLTKEFEAEFLTMAEEYLFAGEDRYRPALADFDAYLRSLSAGSRGLGLPPGRVPHDTYWLASGGRLLGRSTIRHHLTPDLEHEGGHVGYDIRPSGRRKGYGTLILGLTLGKARELGLKRVFLTCDTDNVGSAKIVEKNGGVLQDEVVSRRTGRQISRYWIEL